MRVVENRLLIGNIIVTILMLSLISGCGNHDIESSDETAVTNSYLEAAVSDLLGDGAGVFSLSPPGMCPGHFDISPGDVKRLASSRVLITFDYQQGGLEKVSALERSGLKIASVSAGEGLCRPATYLEICLQVCEILKEFYPELETNLDSRLGEIEVRMGLLEAAVLDRVERSGLKGSGILTSHHQSSFTEWLGLVTIGTFAGSDQELVGDLNRAILAGRGEQVSFIIANEQEGTNLAGAIARQFDAPMVVFGNFPDGGRESFDELVNRNVENLVKYEK